MKIDVELYEQIKTLYLVDCWSQRAIAKKLNISRNTVSKYFKGTFVPWKRKTYTERSNLVVTQEVTEFTLKCLIKDQQHNIKKQSLPL